MLTDQEIINKYGRPGDPTRLTIITLPYRMRIAWKPEATVTKIQCHKLVASQLISIFTDIQAHYGYEELKRLGIDLYGGCVNVRLMRGSKTKWSRHAWGIAIDIFPQKNGLKMKWKDAEFSKPAYAPMLAIFYKHGFMSYGKERNFDAMHFEVNE